MAESLSRRALDGAARLSARQFATAGLLAGGSIVLARSLGASLLGVHAIATFLVAVLQPVLDFGLHQNLIRQPREGLDERFLGTAFTLRLLLAAGLLLLVAAALGPLVAWWYSVPGLYWLLLAAFAAQAVASPFRVSLSLLEKDMDYGKVAALEFLATLAFYLPAGVMAVQGYGLEALVVGELARGLCPAAAFALRPFKLRLVLARELLPEMLRFGSGYLSGVVLWMLNTGLNPVVVGKLAGLEAAGCVRVAEGLATQVGFLKGIGDRLSYPMLAELRAGAAVRFVERFRLVQFVLGALPVLALAVISPRLVPALYGPAFEPVPAILLLLGLSSAVSSVFGVYSAALVTAGRAWRVTQFHFVYALALWSVTPLLVSRLGAIGYGAAFALAAPCHAVIQLGFTRSFGPIGWARPTLLATASWGLAALSFQLGGGPVSALVFASAQGLLVALDPGLRAGVREVFSLLRRRGGAA